MAEAPKISSTDKLKELYGRGAQTAAVETVDRSGKRDRVIGKLTHCGKIQNDDGQKKAPVTFIRDAYKAKGSGQKCANSDCASKLLVKLNGVECTVADIPDGAGDGATSGAKLTKLVSEYVTKNSIKLVDELHAQLHAGALPPRFVFRVLRIDETIDDGIRPRDRPSDDPCKVAMHLYNHVTHGSNQNTDLGFVPRALRLRRGGRTRFCARWPASTSTRL
jgi:hypothetical protein